jgi:hypothetical protein
MVREVVRRGEAETDPVATATRPDKPARDDDKVIEAAIQGMLQQAGNIGMSESGVAQLDHLVRELSDVWKISL